MRLLFITTILLLSFHCRSQILISGTICDTHKNPLIGANIIVKGTYAGATSDTAGNFSFKTEKTDSLTILVSYIGYETTERTVIFPENTVVMNFELKESASSIDAVTISASTFEAADSKRSVLLKSIDIITTANSEGDIYGMLNTLPGAQEESETGKIIVRGGESDETKTYMDGVLISSPYTSQLPDIPARGRFSPMLFNGLLFSTGGYSAEYGQALSSVLSLNTGGLEEESLTSISLMNVGVGAGVTRRFENSSLSAELNYTNLALYFAMIKDNLDWEKIPETFSGNVQFRKKTGENGMLKSFLSGSSSSSTLNYFDYERNALQKIRMNEDQVYHKTTFNTELKNGWIAKTGLSWTTSNETKTMEYNRLNYLFNAGHLKMLLEKQQEKVALKTGTEIIFSDFQNTYNTGANQMDYGFDDLLGAYFLETDITLNKKFAFRLGGRTEYSSASKKQTLLPGSAWRIKQEITVRYPHRPEGFTSR